MRVPGYQRGCWRGTNGDVGEREAVTHIRAGVCTALQNLTYLEAVGGDDVALHTILILDEGDTCAAVGIILDGEYGCLEFITVADKVHQAVHSLVSAAAVTNGHLTGVVAATGALKGSKEFLVGLLRGDFVEGADSLVALAGSYRLVLLDCHSLFSFLDICVEINLIFTCKSDICLLEVIGTTFQKTGLGVALLALSVVVEGVHLCYGNAVHLLNCSLDLKLVGLAVNDETVFSVTIGLIKIPIVFSPLLYSCCEDVLHAVHKHQGMGIHNGVGIDLVNGYNLHIGQIAG